MFRNYSYFFPTKIFFLLFLFSVSAALLILILSFLKFKNSNFYHLEKPLLTDGNFDFNEKEAYFMGKKISPPLQPFPFPIFSENVLSFSNNDDKWIEVDLTNQKLRAWEGKRLVYEFLVSTGKKQWGTPTPVGVYRIWIKLRNTKMSGGSGSNYYYLPNVQCVQYFYKGYGIHGAYWHNNFGHPMSHGCVNMRDEDACILFYWTSPFISYNQKVAKANSEDLGTKVVIHGETPWD